MSEEDVRQSRVSPARDLERPRPLGFTVTGQTLDGGEGSRSTDRAVFLFSSHQLVFETEHWAMMYFIGDWKFMAGGVNEWMNMRWQTTQLHRFLKVSFEFLSGTLDLFFGFCFISTSFDDTIFWHDRALLTSKVTSATPQWTCYTTTLLI